MQNARIKMFNSSLTNMNMPMSEHFRRQWDCGQFFIGDEILNNLWLIFGHFN